MLAFLRAIKFAFQDFFRNLSLSLMTVLILALMLLSVNTLIMIRFLTNAATESVEDKIDVSIFFPHEATDKQVEEVRKYVQSFPEVTTTTFYSREEVLAQFREKHEDNPEILASIEELGGNPLGPTMIIKTRDPDDFDKVMTALSVPEYKDIVVVDTFTDTGEAIERIHTITTQVERFSVATTALFAIIAFLIIFNTIRIAIYTQRVEISIKKLVGATNWFIRSPYIIEAFIFTVLSVVLSGVIVFFSLRFLDPHVAVIFNEGNVLTNYFFSHIVWLLGVQAGAVLLLTIVSSVLAMSRHLRV